MIFICERKNDYVYLNALKIESNIDNSYDS